MSLARRHYAVEQGLFNKTYKALAHDFNNAVQNLTVNSDLYPQFFRTALFLLSLPFVAVASEAENNTTTSMPNLNRLSETQKALIVAGCIAAAALLLTIVSCCVSGSKFCDMTLNGRREPARRRLLA